MNKPKILVAHNKPPKTYLNALSLVGFNFDCSLTPKDLSLYRGLLLIGGGDIFPPFFNGNSVDFRGENLIRDVCEINLFDYFYSKNLPILGICRGLQLINARLGGSLKVVKNHQGANLNDVNHPLISPSQGFLKDLAFANSNHRQAVDCLCPQAENPAFSHDEIVEGFSVGRNILAVQFHPERMDRLAISTVYGEFYKLVKKIK